MPFVIFALLAMWFQFGTPSKNVANWFWEYDAAPWEALNELAEHKGLITNVLSYLFIKIFS